MESSFNIILNDINVFKEAFESISTIVDEVICHIDNEGFRVNAIDRSHICFVSLDLKKELFDEYECSVPEKICLDTIEFMKILKRSKKNDTLQLTINDNNLIIIYDGEVHRTFKIRLIDLEYETPTPPQLKTPANIICETSLFKDFITDMELFNENLTIIINTEYLIIQTDSEFGDSTSKYYHGEQINNTYKSSFSIEKLKQIMKANRFSPIINIGLGNDMPLKIGYNKTDAELNYLLAPRLSEED